MDVNKFLTQTSHTLQLIEQIIHDHYSEIDVDDDGNFVLEFPSGRQAVFSVHKPTEQLWLAHASGAHHFNLSSAGWVSTKQLGLVTALEQIFAYEGLTFNFGDKLC